jgi:hypothetical protein
MYIKLEAMNENIRSEKKTGNNNYGKRKIKMKVKQKRKLVEGM